MPRVHKIKEWSSYQYKNRVTAKEQLNLTFSQQASRKFLEFVTV